MPTSTAVNDADGSARSNRSRPGSSAVHRDMKAAVLAESETENTTPSVKVTVTLTDRSTYYGEVDANGISDGMGVLESVFGSTYAGAMKDGKKHGAGVELHPNGTSFSGDFRDGAPSGYGVYVGALGSKYMGQWENGARHGVGSCIDADAVMTTARFNMDEPAQKSREDGGAVSDLSWEDVEPHILRAVIAEKTALRNQEAARQRHLEAVLQEMTAIGSETLNTPASIETFEAKEELELAEFLRDQSNQIREVAAAAGELKFTEAQLMQRQKDLRAEITARRQELARVAKYVALAETRAAQVQEAERTLATLQRQLDVLQPGCQSTQTKSHVRTSSHVAILD